MTATKNIKGLKSIQNRFKTNVIRATILFFRIPVFWGRKSLARGCDICRLVGNSEKYQRWFQNLLHLCGHWTGFDWIS